MKNAWERVGGLLDLFGLAGLLILVYLLVTNGGAVNTLLKTVTESSAKMAVVLQGRDPKKVL